jgi:hypothetical protein
LPSLALLLQAIALQSASPQWLKNGGEFIPLPETWLNQERWTDDFRVTPPAASKATPFNPPVARRRLYERAAAALAGGQVSPAIHDAWIPKIDGVSTREAAEGLWKEIPG